MLEVAAHLVQVSLAIVQSINERQLLLQGWYVVLCTTTHICDTLCVLQFLTQLHSCAGVAYLSLSPKVVIIQRAGLGVKAITFADAPSQATTICKHSAAIAL